MVPVRGVLSHSCLRKANGDNGMVTGFGCLPGIAGEAIVHQAEERIGAEMFALFGSNHRHSKLHHENSQSFRSGGIFASMFTKGQHRGHGDHWAWRLTGNYCSSYSFLEGHPICGLTFFHCLLRPHTNTEPM